MAVLLLSELMGTRYITDAHVSALTDVLDKIQDGDEVDLTGCRFFEQAGIQLNKFFGTVKMHNSEDEYIEAMLKRNYTVMNNRSEVVSSIPLPNSFDSSKAVIEYVKNIDNGKMYNLNKCATGKVKCLSLAIILSLRHPDVMLDLGIYAVDLFKQVRVDWLCNREPWDKYIEVTQKGMIVERNVIDGEVYIPGIGTMPERNYVVEKVALPYVFGKEQLNNNPQFKDVWDTAARNLQSNMKASKTMKDFIELFD